MPPVARKKEFTDGDFFAASPLMIFPQTQSGFSVYLRLNNNYVLYSNAETIFTEEHRQRLYNNGVEEIFVLTEQKLAYDEYVERNLGEILQNDSLPVRERAKVFYKSSVGIIKETFESRLPTSLDKRYYDRIAHFVEQGVSFMSKQGSLKNLASLISHDYQTYSHCVQVFVFTAAILQTYDALDNDTIIQCGIGAILHDLGKTRIPRRIINKPGPLNHEERQEINRHPLHGVAMTANASISKETYNSILFHHERMDGGGYPAGMQGDDIPLPVRVLSVCDVYDALTSDRPYAKQITPFEALSIMRDEMDGAFDQRVFKRLVMVLSGAKVI